MVRSIAIVISDPGRGGVERMLVNTAAGLAGLGVHATLLVGAGATLAFEADLPAGVVLERLPRRGARRWLARWLARNEPDIAVSGKLPDDALVVAARDRAGVGTAVYFRVGNPLGFRLGQRTRVPLLRAWRGARLRRLYARADGCIAVSRGNARDLHHALGVPEVRIRVLPNPVVTPALQQRAAEDPGHPWLAPGAPPVVLGVGGLRNQKDFPTLVRAFAALRARGPVRLILLGEGRQRSRLEALAAALGVAADVDLPGWAANPYAFMQRAAVFALSSRWEGFGNVLVEAAALGRPVVATDCPYGPREILGGGRYGALVPVGDAPALAQGLARGTGLDGGVAPLPDSTPAAAPFTLESSARAYAHALWPDS